MEVQIDQSGHDKLVSTVNHVRRPFKSVLAGYRAGADGVDAVISNLQNAGVEECVLRIQSQDRGIGDDDAMAHGCCNAMSEWTSSWDPKQLACTKTRMQLLVETSAAVFTHFRL